MSAFHVRADSVYADHRPTNEDRPGVRAPGTVEGSVSKVEPLRQPNDTECSQEEQRMPSFNVLREVDLACIRNLTAAVARGEPLQPQLEAAVQAFEMTYAERPTLVERPAREIAA